MTEIIEINQLDLRYERLRLKDERLEAILLSSILEQGILDPLYVINSSESTEYILLDGFKRYGCAIKLHLSEVPVTSLDSDEAMGILKLLRLSAAKGLNILEEASLVDELYQKHDLNTSEISRRLERSVAWVSARLGIFTEMSAVVKEKIFSGKFPVRNYMYTLRPYTRVNKKDNKNEVESFVTRVAGKKYSTRDIELLAGAWFKGSKLLKEQVKVGDLDWTLRQLKNEAAEPGYQLGNLSESQAKVISNLQIVTSIIFKLNSTLGSAESDNGEFTHKGRVTAGRLINMLIDFKNILREFYDRCGQKTGNPHLVSFGQE